MVRQVFIGRPSQISHGRPSRGEAISPTPSAITRSGKASKGFHSPMAAAGYTGAGWLAVCRSSTPAVLLAIPQPGEASTRNSAWMVRSGLPSTGCCPGWMRVCST